MTRGQEWHSTNGECEHAAPRTTGRCPLRGPPGSAVGGAVDAGVVLPAGRPVARSLALSSEHAPERLANDRGRSMRGEWTVSSSSRLSLTSWLGPNPLPCVLVSISRKLPVVRTLHDSRLACRRERCASAGFQEQAAAAWREGPLCSGTPALGPRRSLFAVQCASGFALRVLMGFQSFDDASLQTQSVASRCLDTCPAWLFGP